MIRSSALACALLLSFPLLNTSVYAGDISDMIAGDRDMRIIFKNRMKSSAIKELRATNPGSNQWGDDLMMGGDDVIEAASGRYFRLNENLFDGCTVDFQATLVDGRKKVLKNIDVCATDLVEFK